MDIDQTPDTPATDVTDTGGAPETSTQDTGPSTADAIASALREVDAPDTPADDGQALSSAAGMARDELGRFAGKQQTTPEPTPAPNVRPTGAAADPNAPKPPAVDPLAEPPGLQPAARERFRSLVDMVKERDGKLAEVQQQYQQAAAAVEEFRETIISSQMTDQEFLTAIDYGRAVKSGDWQTVEGILATQLAQFRMATGRDPEGSDPLAPHQDVQQAIQAGQMNPRHAIEVARARHLEQQAMTMRQRQIEMQQQAQQQERQQAEFNAAIDQGTKAVATLVSQWAAGDLDWPRKQKMIEQRAAQIAQTTHPSQWARAIQDQYDLITESVRQLAPPVRQPMGPGAQPLRSQGGPAGSKQPANTFEAVQAALRGYTE